MRKRKHQQSRLRPTPILVGLALCFFVAFLFFHGLLSSGDSPGRVRKKADKGVTAAESTDLMEEIEASALPYKASVAADMLARKGVKPLDMNAARHKLREQPAEKSWWGSNPPLVIYVLLEPAEEANEANFQYYLREGIREDDGCQHVILIDPKRDLKALPRLPMENAKYVRRKPSYCFWKSLGDLLQSGDIDLAMHSNFVVVSSALRGPFLPVYSQTLGLSWPLIFTLRLSETVKLVGPIISCQNIAWPEMIPESERVDEVPHLDHQMFAFDKVALGLLQKDPRVFTCYESDQSTTDQTSSVMSALAILQNGFSLDCLMQRYQGVKWADRENWGCNAGLKADEGENYYDGISLHPFEVVFVPVTDMLLQKGFSTAKAAKKYDTWSAAQAAMTRDVKLNLYAFDPLLFRAPMIAYMERRGPGCFDFEYYSSHSPEVKGWPVEELWAHFVQSGQFEDRLYRFNCVDILGRSHNCFDTEYYNRANEDLNQLRLEGRALSPREAWGHFLSTGYFESRNYRFKDVCSEDLDSPNNLGEGV